MSKPNLYDALVAMLRAHWKTHNNQYPQCIELSPLDWQQLHEERQLVNDTMNFKMAADWQQSFHGAVVRQAANSCLVDITGQRIPVVLVDDAAPSD